jgi:hypothetical protein
MKSYYFSLTSELFCLASHCQIYSIFFLPLRRGSSVTSI